MSFLRWLKGFNQQDNIYNHLKVQQIWSINEKIYVTKSNRKNMRYAWNILSFWVIEHSERIGNLNNREEGTDNSLNLDRRKKKILE